MKWFRWYVRRKTRPGDQGQLLVEWTYRWVRHPVTKKYIFSSFSQWKQTNWDEDIFEHLILRWKFRKGANRPFWHQVTVFLAPSKKLQKSFGGHISHFSAHLELSFLGGLISVSGSANYLRDEKVSISNCPPDSETNYFSSLNRLWGSTWITRPQQGLKAFHQVWEGDTQYVTAQCSMLAAYNCIWLGTWPMEMCAQVSKNSLQMVRVQLILWRPSLTEWTQSWFLKR